MTQVIIDDILPYTQVVAGSGQTVYGTSWTANFATDVVVYSYPAGSSADDSIYILDPSLYSVAFIGSGNIVQVTLVNPSTLGDIVTITRMTPADRENLYTNTNFTPSMLNNDFGILTLVDQQAQLVNQLIGPRYNYSAVINANNPTLTVDTILPILGASQIWIKNPGNTAIVAADIDVTASGTVNLGLVNELAYYQTTGTEVNGLLTASNGTLITDSSGVPSISSILPNAVQLNITALGAQIQALNMNSHLINNVTNPISAQDAATKAYVDSQVAGGDPLTTKGDLFTFTTVPARLPVGTTNTQILQVNSAASTGLAWSTATYPVTTTINQLLYSSSANTIIGLATGNNGVLITDAGGIPSISSTLPSAVQTNITALGAQSQALNMNSHLINNVTDPVSSQDAATKNYVDQTALNGTSVYAASAATLGTVTQSGAGVGATLTNAGVQATFALDSVSPPVGSNVLIKNTATGMTAANEGIYTVTSVGSGATNWILTRATSYDTATEINNTGLILIQNGTTLGGTAWYNAATIITVDTTNFNYTEFGSIVFPITLAHGGTGAALTASNGGIFYSNASAGAILSGTATANQVLLSGSSTTPAWSTATYPATTTINQLLYSSAANTIVGLATVNSAVLVTSSGGVPSLSTTLPTNLAMGTPASITLTNGTGLPIGGLTGLGTGVATALAAAVTGSGGIVLANTPTLVTPNLGVGTFTSLQPATNGGAINSNLGDTMLTITSGGASSVNYININNAPTTFFPAFSAAGSDTNITLSLLGKGTGGVRIQGNTAGGNATAGYVGELISSVIASASGVTFSTTVTKDLTTISVTAGDWDVFGNILFNATTITGGQIWISLASATQPDTSLLNYIAPIATSSALGMNAPYFRVSVSSTTPVYISGIATGTGTIKAQGGLYARRVR